MNTSYPLHKIKVALFEGIHTRAQELLSAEGYTIQTHTGAATGTELADLAAGAHMVGIRSKTTLDRAFFENSAHLWAVGCFCIGTNQVDLRAAADHGIAVFNAPFSNTRSVAEKTICEIIALNRRLFQRSAELHAGKWNKSASGAHEVRGRALGIIGYGRIGSQVSVLAESLGMRVAYYDISERLPLGNAEQVRDLNKLLAESDVVTIHVPETGATRNLIANRELALMKPDAFIINNARGSVVDLDALADAIRAGRLAGAAVDVFPEEPASGNATFTTPLQGLPNVILTPHVGGSTLEAQRNIAEEVAVKLSRFMNNGSTTTAVNVPEVDLPRLHSDHRRILHFHRNVPGVLSKIHGLIAQTGVNIAAEFLQSNPQHSYVILDVSSSHEDEIVEGLRAIPETIRVRTLF
ncbi:MAG: phosphoglycerate dehydrogenase [Phycisphaerales bacterium]|nr:phosphoglycerate dehydrogenase [Phycisphaerales bacterium]